MFQFILIFLLGIAAGAYLQSSGKFSDISFFKKDTAKTSYLSKLKKTVSKAKSQASSGSSATSSPAAPKTAAYKPVSDVRLYTVQVASFKNQVDAKKFLLTLQKKQIDAYIAKSDLQSNRGWYRIYVGEYADKRDAEEKLSSLQSSFKEAFIQKLE